jgi:hypothetical protein
VSVNVVKLHPEFLADRLAQVNLGENLKAGRMIEGQGLIVRGKQDGELRRAVEPR